MQNLQQRAQRIAAKRSSMWVYRLVRRTIKVVLYPYFRVQCRGGEHLDIDGPVIVAPVHRSNLDTPLLAGMGHRRLRALSKESLFENWLFGAFLSALGAFPVRRGLVDRAAILEAVKMLEAGEQVVVFPEGTRQTGPRVEAVFDGASYLASRTGAAIVPVGIAGTEAAMASGTRLPRRVRVAMVAGPPIRPPEGRRTRPQVTCFSETVRERLQQVFDEAQSLAAERAHPGRR